MITLSTRFKESVKIGLAVSLVYITAMHMGWAKPHWAAIGAVTINVTSAGISLLRGTIRSTATFFSAVIALILIAFFHQDRFGFMFASAGVIAACTYMMFIYVEKLRLSTIMFWFVLGITFMIVAAVVVEPESRDIFRTAWTRTVQTAQGCYTYVLVAALIWPRTSKFVFLDSNQKLGYIQRRLFNHYRRRLLGKSSLLNSKLLRVEEVQALTNARLLMEAAEVDTHEVWEVRRQWQLYQQQSGLLFESYEAMFESLGDIKQPQRVIPNLEAYLEEIDQRFLQIQRMLRKEQPKGSPRQIALDVDPAEWQALSAFEQAAITVTRERLQRLEYLTGTLYDIIADIRQIKPCTTRPKLVDPLGLPFGLPLDSLRYMIIVVAAWILGYLCWILIYDIPGQVLFPMMAGVFGLVVALVPLATMAQLYLTWMGGALWAAFFYIFIMQHLTGYMQLGPMIFFAIFVMHYIMWEDRLGLLRAFTMVSFVLMLSVDNHQTYTLQHIADWLLWMLLVLTVAIACAFLLGSRMPKKVVWRLMNRFFIHVKLHLTLSRHPPDQPLSWNSRLMRFLYCENLVGLAGKIAFYANAINYSRMPGGSAETFKQRVDSIYTLAFWVKDVLAARKAVAALPLDKKLDDELQQWQQALEAWFDRPGDPSQPTEAAARELSQRLAGLEQQLASPMLEQLKAAQQEETASAVYRLLGSYRGLSKAALAYDALPDTQTVDWYWFKEARF